MSTQNQYIDPTGRMAESTMRIQDLAQAEKVSQVYLHAHAFNVVLMNKIETCLIDRNCSRSFIYII